MSTPKKSLSERGKNLEEEFFAQQNKELVEKLRKETDKLENHAALSKALGIQNASVIKELLSHDIHHKTVVALSLVPLIHVAWADGSMDEKEKKAILEASKEFGVDPGEPGYLLLENWLTHKPKPQLFETWKTYFHALAETMKPDTRTMIKSDLLNRARKVAEAAGGILGMGNKISPEEQAALIELEEVFKTGS